MEILSTAHFIVYLGFSLFIGASIGSFLNVCILRIPRNMSLSIPGSHCFHCGSSLGMSENIPIFGYFLLRGKCKHCGLTYAFQYVWVEIIFAVIAPLFLMASISNDSRFIDPVVFISLMTFFSLMMIVIFVDWKWFIIPDVITIPYIILFWVLNLFFSISEKPTSLILFKQEVKPQHLFYASIILLILYLIHFIKNQLEFQPRKIDKFSGILLFIFILINLFFLGFTDIANNKPFYISSLFGGIFGGLIIYIIMVIPKITALLGLNESKEFIGEGDLKLCALIGSFFGGILIIDIFKVWIFITLILGSFHILYLAKRSGVRSKDILIALPFYGLIILSLLLFFLLNKEFVINKSYLSIVFITFIVGSFGFYFLIRKWTRSNSIPISLPMGPYLGIATFIYFMIHYNIINRSIEIMESFKLWL